MGNKMRKTEDFNKHYKKKRKLEPNAKTGDLKNQKNKGF